ncbi:MAG: DUF1592 domain-containing protein [Planctomycetaceae bacterium]
MRAACLVLPVLLGTSSSRLAAEDITGEQIWRESCAACHGEKGGGSADAYADPLVGDRPLAELTKVIDETMPEGDPEALSPEDSAKVAAYVYDAFYSPDAQARNQPPKIELSRLTVRQYRNAVADLAGSFRGAAERGDAHGLKAEYYRDRRTRRDNLVIERIDPQIAFNFGVGSPDAEKIEPHEFAMQWEGSVIAPETGDYEIVIKTEHATRLWLNDPETPFIDAWVKSGDGTEYRETITLLGGRAYPLRLEFSKAKQGVDDSDKQKGPPPKVQASIVLAWKRPGQPEQVIPDRHLSPGRAPKVLVVKTPFPPDDRSTGYERGSAISKAWDEATTFAAIEVAQKIVDDLERLASVKNGDPDRKEKLRKFCTQFVERAYRRPLTDELKKIVVDRQFDEAKDLETAVKRVVLLALKSPRFLYHEKLTPGHDAYDVASRLSFGLWDSLPDQPLLDAAAKNQLGTREQILAQAKRMLDDPRAEAKLREFLHVWLGVERFQELTKDPQLYPGFDAAVVSDLQTSLDLFLQDVIDSEASDFRRLLLDDSFYANGRLAKIYGIELPEDAPFQKVSFQPEHRAGVLSHPYLLAGYAYYDTSSPIHRGVFIARSVLGRTLMPPPEAITPVAPDLHPDLSTRERVDLQTSAAECRSCHDLVNPLGFSLEHFDAIGRFRAEEQGESIDASGSLITQENAAVAFSDAKQLATMLAGDAEVHEAFVEQLFRHVAKQPVRAFGPNHLSELTRSFENNEFSIRRLLAEIVTASARPADETEKIAASAPEPAAAK